MSSTTSGKPVAAPKKKREHNRAILDAPVKFTGEFPTRKRGGRKSTLEPMVDALIEDPNTWYKLASGKKGTVSQARTRLLAIAKKREIVLEVETHASDDTNADCYARFIAPAK